MKGLIYISTRLQCPRKGGPQEYNSALSRSADRNPPPHPLEPKDRRWRCSPTLSDSLAATRNAPGLPPPRRLPPFVHLFGANRNGASRLAKAYSIAAGVGRLAEKLRLRPITRHPRRQIAPILASPRTAVGPAGPSIYIQITLSRAGIWRPSCTY